MYGVVHLDQYNDKNNNIFRTAKEANKNIQNGSVVQLTGKSAVRNENYVWVANTPTASAGLTNLWMVVEPGRVRIQLADGSLIDSPDQNPQNFINFAGRVFTVVRLEIGMLVTLTLDAITGDKASNEYIVATAGDFKLNWAAAPVSGVSLKLIGQNDLDIANNTWAQKVTAYQFEVVALA